MDIIKGVGGFIGRVLGAPIEDLAGVLGADWLTVKRAENLTNMIGRAQERLRARRVDATDSATLSVAIPLLKAAGDEDRGELVDLWARHLAAAVDPARAGKVRQSFIDTVAKMDPADALIFDSINDVVSNHPPMRDVLAQKFQKSPDEIEVSFANLIELGCAVAAGYDPGVRLRSIEGVDLTAKGRELRRLLSD